MGVVIYGLNGFEYFLDVPIESWIIQEIVDRDVLLQEAVSQDGHRGEADVVHRQIGCIIQGLGGRSKG